MVQGREANRRRRRLTEPTTKALCQTPQGVSSQQLVVKGASLRSRGAPRAPNCPQAPEPLPSPQALELGCWTPTLRPPHTWAAYPTVQRCPTPPPPPPEYRGIVPNPPTGKSPPRPPPPPPIATPGNPLPGPLKGGLRPAASGWGGGGGSWRPEPRTRTPRVPQAILLLPLDGGGGGH